MHDSIATVIRCTRIVMKMIGMQVESMMSHPDQSSVDCVTGPNGNEPPCTVNHIRS